MAEFDRSRRGFLAVAAITPLALCVTKSALAQGAACYDPATLPASQAGMRKSLGYVEASPEPDKKRCGLCAFFTGTQAGCGTCVLLSGNPVNAGSVCNSFAAKTS